MASKNITEEVSLIIANLLQKLAKVDQKSEEEPVDKQDQIETTALQNLPPPNFFVNNDQFAFQSPLHLGNYGGIFHGSVMDPYGLMAMLGFLVFLFYIIYNYLNATGNATGGRSLILVNMVYKALMKL